MPIPYAVSTVCLRRYELPRALEVAHALGFDAVDLVGLRGLCEHVPIHAGAEEMRRVATEFSRTGMRAASINSDPGSFDGYDDPAQVMERIDFLLEFAGLAGAPLLVLPCGEKKDNRQGAPDRALMVEWLNRAAGLAYAAGIRLAVEAPYFGRPIDRVLGAARLFSELDPDIEIAFDVSHIEAAGDSVNEAWELLAPRVGIVHLRDAVPGDIRRVIGRGQVDFEGFSAAMSESGYTGDVVLELETRNSPFETKVAEIAAAVEYLAAREHRVDPSCA